MKRRSGDDGRILFTKEMRRDYTILAPQMLPIHFELLEAAFRSEGYRLDVLTTTHRAIADQGLRVVHNDTCYPALLVIGQLIEALESGRYDRHKTALMITQTGGGCRASNYIHLLRKALSRAGYGDIPVVSLNLAGMEKNPGFKMTPRLLFKLTLCVLYGDLMMWLAGQTRPYETEKGATDTLVGELLKALSAQCGRVVLSFGRIKRNLAMIARRFSGIAVRRVPKVRVGIVGEIYVKYAPLGNNGLESFLAAEGAEAVVPGLMDFLLFMADHRITDAALYGGQRLKSLAGKAMMSIFTSMQDKLIAALEPYPLFTRPARFDDIRDLVEGYTGHGNKMGEGWLLTAEILELVRSGVHNVICTQPFGCLPNHISGKGMLGLIKRNHPEANIVAVDYDPGASRTNQENRIKLMLASARIAEPG